MPNFPPLLPPEAFHLQGAAGWLALGNVKESRAELEQLSAAHREHPDVLESWWRVFSEEKNWPAAFECGAKLSVVAPSRATGWIAQAFALHELKRTREAYELLHSVVGRFREHFVIPYNLACYQCQLGNKEEALKWLQRAIDAADAKTIHEMAMEDADLSPLRKEMARLF
jgi:tetratricopeptide (TPR) repeat protein